MVELESKVVFNAGSFKIIIPKPIADSLKLKAKDVLLIDVYGTDSFICRKMTFKDKLERDVK